MTKAKPGLPELQGSAGMGIGAVGIDMLPV